MDWGLGHTARCIPIIAILLDLGVETIVACTELQEKIILTAFPHIKTIPLHPYGIVYAKKKWQLPFVLTAQLPKLALAVRKEKKWLEKTIKDLRPDLVISDNRLGLSHPAVPCVYITHQLTIKAPAPWLETLLRRAHYRYIDRFAACWVPDWEGIPNLAGDLSHPPVMPKAPVSYLGPLTRFKQRPESADQKEICILLSGPEPQRSQFEKMIFAGINECKGYKITVFRGSLLALSRRQQFEWIDIIDLGGQADMQAAVESAGIIVSRCGYTTVMEMLALGKKSVLVPTPGQTEQEYLAERLMRQGWALCIPQVGFSLSKALSQACEHSFTLPVYRADSWQAAIKDQLSI